MSEAQKEILLVLDTEDWIQYPCPEYNTNSVNALVRKGFVTIRTYADCKTAELTVKGEEYLGHLTRNNE